MILYVLVVIALLFNHFVYYILEYGSIARVIPRPTNYF
jgi:hypothetical protein